MGKLDPIVSEFETEEEAKAYEAWFRAQVEEGLKSKGPWTPHEHVMKEARAVLERHRAARNLGK